MKYNDYLTVCCDAGVDPGLVTCDLSDEGLDPREMELMELEKWIEERY